MNDIVKAYYRDYKKVIISILMFVGTWSNDSKQSKISSAILCSLSLLTLLLLILGVLNYSIHSRNINSLVSSIGAVVTFSSILTKGVMINFLWRDVKKLSGGLSVLFESDLKVPENREHLLSYYSMFYRLFKVHLCCCMCFPILSICLPLVEALRGNYVRAYAIRVPFNYTPGDRLHWTIFAFEVMASTYIGTVSFGVDTIFGLFTQQMVGELRLLSHRFRNLKPGKTYRQDLKDCINRHCSLIHYKHKIDKVFGIISLMIALTCAIVVCTVIFQISQKKNLSVYKLIHGIDFIGIKWLQAYTYAWFGNIITVESERCLESMYYSNWTESRDLRVRKDILIIQSQRPIRINAMGIMIVRLDMFAKVVRASLSYFCLLKTIEEKLA